MSNTYYINDIQIYDVLESSSAIKAERSLLSNDVVLIPDINITLLGNHYDPYRPNSIFYGLENTLFKDIIFTIINEDINSNIDCVIKDIEYDYEANQCKLTLSPFVSKKLDNVFEYYNDDITPAQALLEILELNGLKDNIDYPSFWNAKYAQEQVGLLVSITVKADAKKKIIDYLNETATITGADIFIGTDNKIYYLQFNRYLSPVSNNDIQLNKILSLTPKKNTLDIINNFKLSTIYGSFPNESDLGLTSRNNYGDISQELNFESTQSITSKNLSGMIWAGENWVYRNQNPKLTVELKCVNQLDYPLSLLDFFTLSFYNNKVYEVIRIQQNESDKTIDITGVSYE
jgi:hypothetical protein